MVMFTNLIHFSVMYHDQKHTDTSGHQNYILKMLLDIS
jgi:hypothetical protein